MANSFARTSSRADLIAYVDEDDPADYDFDLPRVTIRRGPRIGTVAVCNELAKIASYRAYGMVPDDSEFLTERWDDYVGRAIDELPKHVGVVSPHHNLGVHVDMPFVSREWIDATGWFAYPKAFHWVWPIITGLIGDISQCLVRAGEQEFSIKHLGTTTVGQPLECQESDIREFFFFVALENDERLPCVVERVREAMR